MSKKILIACVTNRPNGVDSFLRRTRQLKSIDVTPLYLAGTSEIARARSLLAATILRDLDPYNYVLLVDDDHEFSEQNVRDIIDHLDARERARLPRVPLLGWYALRSAKGLFDPHVSVKPHDPCPPVDGFDHLPSNVYEQSFWVGGLGFCGMTSESFWSIHQPLDDDDWVCVDDSLPLIKGVYSSGPRGHFWRSEDISFCVHARPQLAEKCVIEHAGRYPATTCVLLDDHPITPVMRYAINAINPIKPIPKHVCKTPKRSRR
jgi:hypothetical protein